MKSETPSPLWRRLTSCFRQQQARRDDVAPYGFATRVAGQWREFRQQEWVRRWERLSIRTAIGTCACAGLFGSFLLVTERTDTQGELLTLPPEPPIVEFLEP